MTDPEREHFVRQLWDLERRLRRWQLACVVFVGLLALSVWGAVFLTSALVDELERERALAVQERVRAVQEAMQAQDKVIRQIMDQVEQRLQEQEKGQKQPGKE